MAHRMAPRLAQGDQNANVPLHGDGAAAAAQDATAFSRTGGMTGENDERPAAGAIASPDTDSDDSRNGDEDDTRWSLGDAESVSMTLNATLDLLAFSPAAYSALSAVPNLVQAWWHVFVLMPTALCLAILSHVLLGRTMWIRGGGPQRLSRPIRRSCNWTFNETACVAIVSHLLPAFIHLSRTRLCPSAERLIPSFSHRLFGIKHQGWSISGVSVSLAPLPRQLAIDLSSHTDSARADAHGDASNQVGAVFLWKSSASQVHHHAIQSFKPAAPYAGIGGGRARKGERVLLLLSGSTYADRDPVAGLLACNMVNLTSLRTLCINWRKPAPRSAGQEGAFPAGLNDALRAYHHLVQVLKFKPENVYLAAEGSGAGVAMGLLLWLSALAYDDEKPRLGRPGKVVLWSPWCDLTMHSPTWKSNGKFDIVDPVSAQEARNVYSSSLPGNLAHRPTGTASHASPSAFDGKQAIQQRLSQGLEEALAQKSSARLSRVLLSSLPELGLEHPLLSPGLPADRDAKPFNALCLSLLGTQIFAADSGRVRPKCALSTTKYLIFCGKDSVFSGEAGSLAANLCAVRDACGSATEKQDAPSDLEVAVLESLDTPTHFNLLPSVFLPQAQAKADELVRAWFVGDVAG